MFQTIFTALTAIFSKDKFLELFKGKETRLLELQQEIAKEIASNMQRQIDVNIQEAKNSNFFVSGWRPFIGWICGLAIAYQFIIKHFIDYYIAINFLDVQPTPNLDLSYIVTLLTGMLGIYGARTLEKIKLK